MTSVGPPRVGLRAVEHRPVCVYARTEGAAQCSAPATVHVLCATGEDVVHLATCDLHLPVARAAGRWRDEHPFRAGVCAMPGTLWHSAPSRCEVETTS